MKCRLITDEGSNYGTIGIGFECYGEDLKLLVRCGVRIDTRIDINDLKKALQMLVKALEDPMNEKFKPCIHKYGDWRRKPLAGNEMTLDDYDEVMNA